MTEQELNELDEIMEIMMGIAGKSFGITTKLIVWFCSRRIMRMSYLFANHEEEAHPYL